MTSAHRSVPCDDGRSDEKRDEVCAASERLESALGPIVHGWIDCNIETALVPLPPTRPLAAAQPAFATFGRTVL